MCLIELFFTTKGIIAFLYVDGFTHLGYGWNLLIHKSSSPLTSIWTSWMPCYSWYQGGRELKMGRETRLLAMLLNTSFQLSRNMNTWTSRHAGHDTTWLDALLWSVLLTSTKSIWHFFWNVMQETLSLKCWIFSVSDLSFFGHFKQSIL